MNFNRFLSSHDSVYPGVSAQGECLPRWGVCPVGCLARECVARGVSPGGVCPGACLPKGGAYCPEGCVARGVSLRVVCLWGVCPGGVYPGGGVCAGRMCILACTGADTPTPVYRILDTRLWKHLSATTVADGKNILIFHCSITHSEGNWVKSDFVRKPLNYVCLCFSLFFTHFVWKICKIRNPSQNSDVKTYIFVFKDKQLYYLTFMGSYAHWSNTN